MSEGNNRFPTNCPSQLGGLLKRKPYSLTQKLMVQLVFSGKKARNIIIERNIIIGFINMGEVMPESIDGGVKLSKGSF